MPSAIPSSARCPVCGKPAQPAAKPFCSQGCRDRDLLQWLSEGHRLPGPPADPGDFDRDGLDSEAHRPL